MRRLLFNRWIAILILIFACVISAMIFLTKYTDRTLAAMKDAYDVSADEFVTSAYKPAASSNPVRQEVNSILGRVLAADLSDQERLELARRGLSHLEDIEKQIDGIGAAEAEFEVVLGRLVKAQKNPLYVRDRGTLSKIIELSRLEESIIEDIRGLSYRANFHTESIFKRIVGDRGSLTEAHSKWLNDQVPRLEQQFNLRSNLYTELERAGNQIDQLFAQLDH